MNGADTPLSRVFAALVVDSRPDEATRAAARDGVLDFLACAIGGLEDGGYRKLRQALAPAFGAAVATIIGEEARIDAPHAAVLNGYLGHALDYDDVQAGVRGHPSTVILPALLAAAEADGGTATALLDAYVVGVEAMARLGRAMGHGHYEAGFHNTATLGPIGAAAAVARLRGLDAGRTAQALGIAATQSAGLRLQFGSEIKPLHAGLAARSGLLAVTLAEAGLEGSERFLDGATSFLAAFAQGQARPALAVEGWGTPWEILSPGLMFKEYACCHAAHLAADTVLDLRAEHGLTAADVDSATITFPRGGDAALVVQQPATGLDGRFSVEYVVAAALTDGRLGIATFADRPVRADIAALLPRMHRRHDMDAPSVSEAPQKRFARVDLRLRDGREIGRTATRVRGARDLHAKFLDAAAGRLGAEAIPGLVARMQDAADLGLLLAALRGLGTAIQA
ncbi:MmgE/PrpD family protein [Pseudoroseomonas globiformis]|uniref:MmgE/PrpD family protein n=1 Tax=Teichococcus globiformis TaxID=2307229 RepID=A0ABV7FWT5_9PROT